jgi:hypothetical protein
MNNELETQVTPSQNERRTGQPCNSIGSWTEVICIAVIASVVAILVCFESISFLWIGAALVPSVALLMIVYYLIKEDGP